MKNKKVKKVAALSLSVMTLFSMMALPVNATEMVEATGTQKAYIVPEDWGPAVTKTVIHLDKEITPDSIGDEEDEFTVEETKNILLPTWEVGMSNADRHVLKAYTSDEKEIRYQKILIILLLKCMLVRQ